MKLAGRRGRNARPRLELDRAEQALLGQLFDELEAVLADAAGGGPADDPVLARLYPAAYPDDEAASAEYRELTAAGLRSQRLQRFGACRADLRAGVIDLADPEAGRRWIQAVNDLRLALGTRLGVTEDAADLAVDPTDPARRPWVIYHWLTYLQDTLVQALMR